MPVGVGQTIACTVVKIGVEEYLAIRTKVTKKLKKKGKFQTHYCTFFMQFILVLL